MSSAITGLSFTARLAHWSAVHRLIILLGTVIVIGLAVFSIIAVGTEIRDDDGGVGESGKGSALLSERFAPDPAALPEVIVELVPLSAYEALLAPRAEEMA